MNKSLSRFILFCIGLSQLPINGQTEYYNQYSHAPTPPGYGVSSYFELAPNKVNNGNTARPRRSICTKMTISANVTGNILRIKLNGGSENSPLSIAIFNLSGKNIFTTNIFYKGTSRSGYSIPLSSLPKGVYFVRAQFQNTSIQAKFIHFEK